MQRDVRTAFLFFFPFFLGQLPICRLLFSTAAAPTVAQAPLPAVLSAVKPSTSDVAELRGEVTKVGAAADKANALGLCNLDLCPIFYFLILLVFFIAERKGKSAAAAAGCLHGYHRRTPALAQIAALTHVATVLAHHFSVPSFSEVSDKAWALFSKDCIFSPFQGKTWLPFCPLKFCPPPQV